MYTFTRNKLRYGAWLMLALLALQGMVVAHEPAGGLFGEVERDASSDVSSLLDASQAVSVSLSADNAAEPCDEPGSSSCDHCCQCHGHGSHVFAPAESAEVTAEPSVVSHHSSELPFRSILIHSIHRPPIA